MAPRWTSARLLAVFLGGAAALLTGGIPSAHAARAPRSLTDDPWAYRAWIDKAGRLLRAGKALTAAEIETLAAKTPDEVLDELMADPAFGDTVLDFNLYFLGAKPATLSYPQGDGHKMYAPEVYQKPQAIAAAQALLNGGDYLQLVGEVPQRFVSPFSQGSMPDKITLPPPRGPVEDPPKPTGAEVRAARHAEVDAAFDKALAGFHPNGASAVDKDAGCKALQEDDSPTDTITNAVGNSGFEGNTNFDFVFNLSTIPQVDINVGCGSSTTTGDTVVARLTAWRTALDSLYGEAEDYASATYKITGVQDIRALPGADTDPILKGTVFGFLGFWNQFPNSSTNYNRKRAAYVLRTYFCDDLTPINVVPGTNSPHPGDRHAGDPGCQACHYKLDPMAGFFKDRGIIGYDFKDDNFFVFDDQATFTGDKLTAYEGSWPQVGYIRSNRDATRNDYGADLPDLLQITRKAPEVTQCLTRRLAEYTLGRGQTVDGGWLAHLSSEFQGPSSSDAFKSVLRELVKSETFTRTDAQPDQCYDYYPPGTVPELPCTVSYVIQHDCATCHASTDKGNGGLDLSHWQQVATAADGTAIKGFPHLDADGNQIAPQETYTRMLSRLSSTDPDQSMPKYMDMPNSDKVILYKWATSQANGGAQ